MIEIDEPPAAKQLVQRLCARGVAPHQPLERGHFVVIEVIDVYRGIASPRIANHVHQLLERRPLFRVVRGPPTVIRTVREKAEQIFAAALSGEAGAFDIQEQITG